MANNGQAAQDPRELAARVAGLKTPASLPVAPGMGSDATGPLQTPQFAAPNAYAYPAGSAPMLSMGILPQTNPVQSASDPDQVLTQALASQTQMSTQETPEQLARARAVSDAVQRKIAEEAAIAPPQHGYGYQPHFQPVTGPVSFLKDLGRVGLLLGGSTGPGRAIEGAYYGPDIRRYEAERAEKAQQIAQLLGVQKQEEEPIAALSSLGPKSMMGFGRGAGGEAAKTRAEGELRHWQNQDAQALDRIGEAHRHNIQTELLRLKALEVTGDQHAIERQELAVRTAIAGMETDAKNYATDAGLYGDDVRAYTQAQVANLVQGAGLKKAHPYLTSGGYLESPQLPVPPAPNRPTRPGRGGRGGVQVTDPRGIVHSFPNQQAADAFKKAAGIR